MKSLIALAAVRCVLFSFAAMRHVVISYNRITYCLLSEHTRPRMQGGWPFLYLTVKLRQFFDCNLDDFIAFTVFLISRTHRLCMFPGKSVSGHDRNHAGFKLRLWLHCKHRFDIFLWLFFSVFLIVTLLWILFVNESVIGWTELVIFYSLYTSSTHWLL